VDLGGVVAPLAAPGTETIRCTVDRGTAVLVAAWSAECSTLEFSPFFGRDKSTLRACARAVNAGITTVSVTVDGKPVVVTEVSSPLERLNLPSDNIFGAVPGSCCTTNPPSPEQGLPYLSVADGWVVLLRNLKSGTHTISIHIDGEFPGAMFPIDNTTTITVT
jgi:hypothetical protein